MKCIYEQSAKVSATLTDTNVEMGLVQALSIVQDNMCEYFRAIQCDGLTMIPACNCFLVVTKTKIKLLNSLKWLDCFHVKSEISGKSKIRINLCTDMVDESGKVFVLCNQEMCAMDATNRTLRMLNTTLVPDDLEITKECDMNFARMNFEMCEEDLVKVHKVDICNLDFYKHTNNVEYVRLMLSTMDLNFVTNNRIVDFEIHYMAESKFDDELKIYRKIKDNEISFVIKNEENIIVKALLNYEKII